MADQVLCPRCGFKNSPGRVTCESCHSSLAEGVVVASTDGAEKSTSEAARSTILQTLRRVWLYVVGMLFVPLLGIFALVNAAALYPRLEMGVALSVATALMGVGLIASGVGISLRRKWGFYVYIPSILGLAVCIAVWSDKMWPGGASSACVNAPLTFLLFLLPVLPVVGLLRDRHSSG